MLSEIERKQILQLLQTPQWQTAERVAKIICESMKGESVIADTQWETIKKTLLREGREQGIKEFIKQMYQIAKNE